MSCRWPTSRARSGALRWTRRAGRVRPAAPGAGAARDAAGDGSPVAGPRAARGRLGGRAPSRSALVPVRTLGVDPDRQGHGLGSALLRAMPPARDGLPAYLECKPAHVGYYARFGFAVSGEVVIDPTLSVVTMWREPQRARPDAADRRLRAFTVAPTTVSTPDGDRRSRASPERRSPRYLRACVKCGGTIRSSGTRSWTDARPRPSSAESMPLRRMSSTFSTPGLAVGGEAPEVGAADHHGPGAERERLDDVAAAPDAAVEQDLDLVADRVGDRRQRADRRRRAVEVVAAVVGHRDRGDAGVDGAAGVVDAHDALEHERAVPLLAQPGDVVPGRRRRLHPLAVGAEERRRRLAGPAAMFGTVRSGSCPVAARSRAASAAAQRPAGANRTIALRSIFSGMHGLPQSRPVENDQSRVTISPTAPAAGRARPAASIRSRVPDPVDLEERLRVGGDDLLDRLAARTSDSPMAVPARGGGAGDGDLAVGMDGLHAGRGDEHRQRDRPGPCTVVARSRSAAGRRRAGAKPSSANAAMLSSSVTPALGAGDQRACRRTWAAASSRAAAPRRPTRTTACCWPSADGRSAATRPSLVFRGDETGAFPPDRTVVVGPPVSSPEPEERTGRPGRSDGPDERRPGAAAHDQPGRAGRPRSGRRPCSRRGSRAAAGRRPSPAPARAGRPTSGRRPRPSRGRRGRPPRGGRGRRCWPGAASARRRSRARRTRRRPRWAAWGGP